MKCRKMYLFDRINDRYRIEQIFARYLQDVMIVVSLHKLHSLMALSTLKKHLGHTTLRQKIATFL